MKESVGYTVTLNIIIVFIVVVFAFLGFALIYFKANKVTNMITQSIEKHEGYNSCSGVTGCAEEEIISKLSSIGYDMKKISCDAEINTKSKGISNVCKLMVSPNGYNNGTKYAGGDRGYCIYLCKEEDDYYYYKIKTNMLLDMPIVSAIDVPIYTNTNRLYNYEDNFSYNDQKSHEQAQMIENKIINNSSIKAYKINEKYNVIILDGYTKEILNIEEFKPYEVIILGDISGNGKVNSDDVRLTIRAYEGFIKLDDYQKMAADINCDGVLNVNDSDAIMNISVGKSYETCLTKK